MTGLACRQGIAAALPVVQPDARRCEHLVCLLTAVVTVARVYACICRFATPMRTPRSTIQGQDSLMQQAANLAKMRDMQTPLLGGENPDLAGEQALSCV